MLTDLVNQSQVCRDVVPGVRDRRSPMEAKPMDEALKVAAPELSPADSRKRIGRIVTGVILGQAILGFLVSITNNLALPAIARGA